MKKYITIILVCLAILGNAQNPTFEWAKRIGGPTDEEGNSIATDSDGNIYTIGSFQGTIDFDPGAGVHNLTASGRDIYIQKLDAEGNLLWVKKLDGIGFSVATDADGNVYTTGYFGSTVDFDPGAGIHNLTAAGGREVFVLKLDAEGNFIWAKSMGGTGFDEGFSITADINGNVYTTGYFDNAADFDPGAGVYNLTSVGSMDCFIQKLDAEGNFCWAKRIGESHWDQGNSVAADTNGNVYLTGRIKASSQGTNHDIFIQKLDTEGNFIWAKRIGGSNGDVGKSITTDANDNIYITGYFRGLVDFNPGGDAHYLDYGGESEIFILKLDANGNFIWAKSMGGGHSDEGRAITTDADGNVYTTGIFRYSVDFDPGADTEYLDPAGNWDTFIQKLDANGNFIWAQQLGVSEWASSKAIATDANSNVYTIGVFLGTVEFDSDEGTQNITSVGQQWDVFIQKFSQCTFTGTDTQTTCNAYTWIDGNTYTESNNTAIFVIEDSATNGCDSIITLDLTITPVTSTDIQTACNTYTWIDGNTYTESNNTATFNITNGATNGCDSLVTLDLTINNVSDITTDVNGSIISANNTNATYQWIDCDNNAPISEATNQDFTPTMNGNYAVEITENGCTETSTCVMITTVGLVENHLEDEFTFFPNPTTGNFTIKFDNIQKNLTVRLFAVSGQLIEHNNFQNTHLVQLEINHPDGIYILEISDDDGNRAMLKLLKQ